MMLPAIPSDSPTPPPRRALVVDDHEDSAAALALMLKSLGHEVVVAHDGVDALRKALEFQPQLVLLDVQMPKLGGYDAGGVIRAQPWGKEVRLIAVTGKEKADVSAQAGRAGFNDYLLKPVDFERLKEAVNAS